MTWDSWDSQIIEEKVHLDVGESQPPVVEKKKGYSRKPLVALKTCNVEFDDCIVELVAGCEVHGLKRQEREYLLFHKFAK